MKGKDSMNKTIFFSMLIFLLNFTLLAVTSSLAADITQTTQDIIKQANQKVGPGPDAKKIIDNSNQFIDQVSTQLGIKKPDDSAENPNTEPTDPPIEDDTANDPGSNLNPDESDSSEENGDKGESTKGYYQLFDDIGLDELILYSNLIDINSLLSSINQSYQDPLKIVQSTVGTVVSSVQNTTSQIPGIVQNASQSVNYGLSLPKVENINKY